MLVDVILNFVDGVAGNRSKKSKVIQTRGWMLHKSKQIVFSRKEDSNGKQESRSKMVENQRK